MTLITPPPIDPEEEEMLVPHSEFATAEGPQPMDAVPAEAANAVDASVVDDPQSARFTWTIDNFSRLTGKKLYSDVFVVGGYKWRVLIFPKGNNVDHLSMYLDVADSTTLPYGWSRYAQFSLALVNQIHRKFTRRDVYGAWEQYLGVEHSDNTPKRSYAANQNRHTFEKPVRIYN